MQYGRAAEADDVAEGGRNEGAVVVTNDPAGKFGAEGGEIIKNKAIDGSGNAAEDAEGAGQSPKFTPDEETGRDVFVFLVFGEEVFAKVFTEVTGEVADFADAVDVGAVGVAPAGSVAGNVATAEGCGIGLVDVTVVVVGEGVNFGAHAVGVSIDVTEFVLDVVPLFAEFGGIDEDVCEEVEMDVSIFLFFGPPDVVDHAVLFAEFGEELVEQAGFNDLIGMALGAAEGNGDQGDAEFYPAAGVAVVGPFCFGEEKEPFDVGLNAAGRFGRDDALRIVLTGTAPAIRFGEIIFTTGTGFEVLVVDGDSVGLYGYGGDDDHDF